MQILFASSQLHDWVLFLFFRGNLIWICSVESWASRSAKKPSEPPPQLNNSLNLVRTFPFIRFSGVILESFEWFRRFVCTLGVLRERTRECAFNNRHYRAWNGFLLFTRRLGIKKQKSFIVTHKDFDGSCINDGRWVALRHAEAAAPSRRHHYRNDSPSRRLLLHWRPKSSPAFFRLFIYRRKI